MAPGAGCPDRRGPSCPAGPPRKSANLSPCGRRARRHKSHIACTARAPPYAERPSGCSRKACWKVRTPKIPIRASDGGAPDHCESGSCCRHHRHQSMTALRCGRARCSSSMRRAVTGRSATSTKLRPSFAAALRHRVIAIAGTICEWRMVRAAMRDMLRDIDALISAAAIHYCQNGHIQIASFPNVVSIFIICASPARNLRWFKSPPRPRASAGISSGRSILWRVLAQFTGRVSEAPV